MRKIALLAMTLTLGACATDPTTGQPTINQQELANVEAQIQQATVNLCKFVPTINTVAMIIGTFVQAGAVIDIVNQAAEQICSAAVVTPTVPASMNGMRVNKLSTPPVVNGVQVHGYFIK